MRSRLIPPTAALAALLIPSPRLSGDVPNTAADVPGPPSGTAMTKAYVQAVGRMAYVWGWPLVNSANRAKAFAKAPEPGLQGGVLPVAYNRIAMLTGYIDPAERFVT